MQHETVSVQMLEFLIQDNVLSPEFDKYGLTDDDFEFIKEQILGSENVRMGSETFITVFVVYFSDITLSSFHKQTLFKFKFTFVTILSDFDGQKLIRK